MCYVLVQYTSPLCVLQVLAGHPHNGQGRGEHVLNCMKAVVPNLHEDLVDLWDAVIPKLLSYLSGMCVVCMCCHDSNSTEIQHQPYTNIPRVQLVCLLGTLLLIMYYHVPVHQ